MEKKIYNKLVRDKIPEIIKASNKTCFTEFLSDIGYIEMLDKKLNEEVLEYQESKDIEELADILEVIYSIAVAKGYGVEKLEKARKEKVYKNGSFDKKILLKEVIE